MKFLDNKYSLWYFRIVNSRKTNTVNGYTERHHIVPKSLGGSNAKDNLVKLTPREHFICHLLLTKMTQGVEYQKMCWALHKLTFGSKNTFTSKQYDTARKIHSRNMKENHPSKISKGWTEKVSNSVKAHWENNDLRRDALRKAFKQYRETNKEEFRSNAAKASKLGIAAYREKNKNKIEYKGKYYYSWSNLERETGVSVFLYKKYYKNNVDPEFRIGANGPLPRKEGL